MKRTTKQLLLHSKYLCPNCKNNNQLFEITEFTINKLFFWEVGKAMTLNYIVCEKCNKKYNIKDLDQLNNNATNNQFGANKTVTFETHVTDKFASTTKTIVIDYSNYVPNIKNKDLYYETILLLMKFLEENDNSIDIKDNKYYNLATENFILKENLSGWELEKKIIAKFEICILEFNKTELSYLLRNSVNVMKGKFAINTEITSLYFKLLDLMEINQFNKEKYFYSLLQ